MTVEDIKKLIEVLRETGISELEVQWGENRVRIRGAAPSNQELVVPTVISVPLTGTATIPQLVPAAPASENSSASASAAREDDQSLLVKSPIVGTYYDAPSPGLPPFVKVGDQVEPKQVLCIIESMKLMNEIEADAAGTVVAKHVENGRPVEYGESLFTIRPR